MMVREYSPDFSTVTERSQPAGRASVGPGTVDAFVVGTGVGGVVGTGVETVVGAVVTAGGSVDKQPVTARRSASTSAEVSTIL
jgi:hypothetical protein